jgi:hypothetical protein
MLPCILNKTAVTKGKKLGMKLKEYLKKISWKKHRKQ